MLVLEKPRFNWDMPGRYVKPLHFQLEETNILETRAYRINDEDRIPVINDWLGWEGLLLIEMFTQEEKEICKTMKGLFSMLSNSFKPCHNCIILTLQYQTLHRKTNESAKELIGKL